MKHPLIKESEALFHELYETLNWKQKSSKIIEYEKDLLLKSISNLFKFGPNYNRILFLLKNLKYLKKEKKPVFSSIITEIEKHKDDINFNSFRFELAIAHSLCVKGIDFKKENGPDFIIYKPQIGIECTSLKLVKKKQNIKELVKKTKKALSKKEDKNYAKSDTLLAIESTNLLFNVPPKDWQTLYNEQAKMLKKYMKKNKYGSILVFYSDIQRSLGIRNHFNRIDSPNISNSLKEFLDKHYGQNRRNVNPRGIPKTP